MFSTPPAMNTSPSPALIACAALAAAWRPEPMYAALTVPRSAFRLRRSEAHPYRLELRIVVQRLAPQVSPEPRELVATDRCRRVVKVVRIDPHGPRLDRACHAVRLLDVLGP